MSERIHDELMPYLFAAAAALAAVQQREDLSETDSQHVDQAARWVNQAREIARDVLAQLRDPAEQPEASFSEPNPVLQAREFLQGIRVGSEPSVQWHDAESLTDVMMSNDQWRAVVANIVEWVRNAWRHANATQVVVAAGRLPRGWYVEVRDDGAGFDFSSVRHTSHGLGLVQQRAAKASINVSCDSDANGTCWRMALTAESASAATPPADPESRA